MKIEPPRRTPDDAQKLIVLDCLFYIGPCTELQLLQFLSDYDQMNYFDMMFALNDLCSNGQAVRTKNQAGHIYQVTDAGKEALQLFGGRVPRSVHTVLQETGDQWKKRFRMEMQYQHQVNRLAAGDYELTLKVTEKNMEMMRLSLSLPTREVADHLANNWPEKAVKVYDAIIRILSEEPQ